VIKKCVRLWNILLGCLLLGACGTYYSQHISFHRLFSKGHIQEADQTLAKNKRAARGRTRLLYHMNRGVTHHLLQEYNKSNEFFEEAYRIHEDFIANPISEALSFLVNPTITDYAGEDHEILFIHYYKALNYVHLGDLTAALVECRRLNIILNQLSDRYSSPSKYKRDAFIHLLMGLIYQANHQYNDAFIAYRNAVEIYQTDYKDLFGLPLPLQLQKDLIYTAYKVGFDDQVAHYQKEFQLAYDPSQETKAGDVVCFWNNGLGPFKDQWEVNFILVKGIGGSLNFVNEELGLFFPFPLPGGDEGAGLSGLHMLRVAFPKYVERPCVYQSAILAVDNQQAYTFERAENLNAIAFKVLHERMIWEFSKSLLRVALKKVAEYQLRKQNEILGTILGVVNFATERADTRNWQTLPHSIYYTRIRLPEGRHEFQFKPQAKGALAYRFQRDEGICYISHTGPALDYATQPVTRPTKRQATHTFSLQVEANKTHFCTLHTPHSTMAPPSENE
jgi:hypothetical protein